jgi:hypothetical protein
VREVDEQPSLVVEDLGADRDVELDVVAVGAALVRAAARAASLAGVARLPVKGPEVPQVGIGDEDDAAAVPAVTSVRPALGDVLLAPEADRAVAAAAAPDVDPCAVVEQGRRLLDDRDDPVAVLAGEGHAAVPRREDRVVAPQARTLARAEARAALPDEDHAGLHVLPVEQLHPEALGLGVAAVLRGPESLLVRH